MKISNKPVKTRRKFDQKFKVEALQIVSEGRCSTMSAIQVKGNLQDYYLRKLSEGKHTMPVLNAVASAI